MNESNKKMQKLWNVLAGLAVMGITAMLTVGVLTSCAPQESQPVVTSDDLTPPSAAQDAIAQEAGGGKTYAYSWQAENVEKTLQAWRESYEQEVNYAKELIAKGEEAVKAAGYPSLKEAQQAVDAQQAGIEQDLAENKKRLEAELALDPVVSAQEAANLAGAIFEKLYGFDLSQETLVVWCFESDSDMSYHPAGGGAMRTVWNVSREEAADGALLSTNSISCTLDATTGELIGVDYTLSNDEIAAMRATAVPACFIAKADPDAAGSYGYWDETEASYAGTVEKLKQQAKEQLSGSALVGGAAVTEVRAELEGNIEESGENHLSLWADCDNGKTYQLYRIYYLQPYVDYDFGGYPLRAYQITNDTYLKEE